MLTYAETAEMLETIAAALSKSGLHEKAGSFMEKLGMAERALEAYRKGHAYRYLKASYTSSLRPLKEAWYGGARALETCTARATPTGRAADIC